MCRQSERHKVSHLERKSHHIEVRKAPVHMPAVQSKYAANILGVLNNPDGVITATRKNRVYVSYMHKCTKYNFKDTVDCKKTVSCITMADGALANIGLLLYVMG